MYDHDVPNRIVTVGAYGFNEASLLAALEHANVSVFCDIRQRRGMRGAAYSFANSNRLQAILRSHGIKYIHLRDLAPTTEVRDLQKTHDSKKSISKRDRTSLSPEFIKAYQENVLAKLNVQDILAAISAGHGTVALFCVERTPEACHRTLAAEFIADELGIPVEHLQP